MSSFVVVWAPSMKDRLAAMGEPVGFYRYANMDDVLDRLGELEPALAECVACETDAGAVREWWVYASADDMDADELGVQMWAKFQRG